MIYKCPVCMITDDSEEDELYCWDCGSKMTPEPDAMDLYKEYRDDCHEKGIRNKYDE